MLSRPSLSPSQAHPETASLPERGLAWRRIARRLLRTCIELLVVSAGAALGAAVVYEMHTSALEASVFSRFAATLTYHVAAGPSPQIAFPEGGPFDRERGYASLPWFLSRLQAQGFRIERQVRMSPELATIIRWGLSPPYPEPALTGLTIRGKDGSPLYSAVDAPPLFSRFDDIPPVLVRTLLYMENRELLHPSDPRSNPVIEWDRLAKATALYLGEKIGLRVPLQGGSTLATQLEKYRHSPDGRTNSALDKLKQMLSATLKAYRDGPDTRAWRRHIVLAYFNTLPLAAAPGYGELHGLGEGLYAWFGMRLGNVVRNLSPAAVARPTAETARAYKHALALLVAVRAPSTFLVYSRQSLERRVDHEVGLLAEAGVIDTGLARQVRVAPLTFLPHAPVSPPESFVEQKATNVIRTNLMRRLGVTGLYQLDRLHLEVDSTFDVGLQNDVIALLEKMRNPVFVAAHGLKSKFLLRTGDPRKVLYSVMLFERTPGGNALRVQADNLDRPFDINDGIKMQLGSTAKLRTLAHYLEIVAQLYHKLTPLDAKALARRAAQARDPITQWAVETVREHPRIDLEAMLQRALDRRYSASPYETFFTGGGIQTFGNFDRLENGRVYTVRQGLWHSVNLVFIRLMRDLERYHRARLPYDAHAVLSDPQNPDRLRLLTEIADASSTHTLARAYRRYRGLSPDALVDKLLGRRAHSPRRLAVLFYAWNHGGDEAALGAWLKRRVPQISPAEIHRLARAYGNPRLNLADYGYLLSKQPLEVWCAGQLARTPKISWKDLFGRSTEPRRVSSAWLFRTRNRRAQDRRLRIRIEQDAFARMTPYWRRLGFPFRHLVASYATAIGSSSDRPAALAELMGIILNGGVKEPVLRMTRLEFARGTPYETELAPAPRRGERVMEVEVARALRDALVGVVEDGTGRRVSGAFIGPDGKRLIVGGKTGSGDNRFKTFNRWGQATSSRAVNRTATFVFYIGNRYFGVVTAYVPGAQAAHYEFTSALPLAVLRLAAPDINRRLSHREVEAAGDPLPLPTLNLELFGKRGSGVS